MSSHEQSPLESMKNPWEDPPNEGWTPEGPYNGIFSPNLEDPAAHELDGSTGRALSLVQDIMAEIDSDIAEGFVGSVNQALGLIGTDDEIGFIARRDIFFAVSSLAALLATPGGEWGSHELFTSLNCNAREEPVFDIPRTNSARVSRRLYFEMLNSVTDADDRHVGEWEEGLVDGIIYPIEAILDIKPGRLNLTISHINDEASERYQGSRQATKEGRTYQHEGELSIRLDLDPNSPTGISLDVGSDYRNTDNFSRPGDFVGLQLQEQRPLEGCHMTEAFAGIGEERLTEFNLRIKERIDQNRDKVKYQEWLSDRARTARRTAPFIVGCSVDRAEAPKAA
jgi:hypothetical protein